MKRVEVTKLFLFGTLFALGILMVGFSKYFTGEVTGIVPFMGLMLSLVSFGAVIYTALTYR